MDTINLFPETGNADQEGVAWSDPPHDTEVLESIESSDSPHDTEKLDRLEMQNMLNEYDSSRAAGAKTSFRNHSVFRQWLKEQEEVMNQRGMPNPHRPPHRRTTGTTSNSRHIGPFSFQVPPPIPPPGWNPETARFGKNPDPKDLFPLADYSSVRDKPFTVDEILCIIWFLTTTHLSFDAIARIANHLFPMRSVGEEVTQYDINRILRKTVSRFTQNLPWFRGEIKRLRKPEGPETRPCHFGVHCTVACRTDENDDGRGVILDFESEVEADGVDGEVRLLDIAKQIWDFPNPDEIGYISADLSLHICSCLVNPGHAHTARWWNAIFSNPFNGIPAPSLPLMINLVASVLLLFCLIAGNSLYLQTGIRNPLSIYVEHGVEVIWLALRGTANEAAGFTALQGRRFWMSLGDSDLEKRTRSMYWVLNLCTLAVVELWVLARRLASKIEDAH